MPECAVLSGCVWVLQWWYNFSNMAFYLDNWATSLYVFTLQSVCILFIGTHYIIFCFWNTHCIKLFEITLFEHNKIYTTCYIHIFTHHMPFSKNVIDTPSVKYSWDHSGQIWIRRDQHLQCRSKHRYKQTVLSCCGDKKTQKWISFWEFILYTWKMQTCRFKSKMYFNQYIAYGNTQTCPMMVFCWRQD